jgi:hypothetical protein
MKDIDYVKLYAEKMRTDNSVFIQYRKFINSQYRASSSLFKNAFAGDFKNKARKYLKDVGLI